MTYGQKYIAELGIAGAIFRINHLRKRMEEVGPGQQAINLASESDNLGRAILEINPKYDWVTNTISN